MRIDEDDVVVGDEVWHDRYGIGTVQRVSAGTCDVLFNASERPLTFTDGGKQHGHKVLFWSKPIIFVPRKGVDYSKFIRVIESLLYLMHGDE